MNKTKIKRYIPLLILLGIILIFYCTELVQPLHMAQIKEGKEEAILWLRQNPISSVFILFTSYILSVCLILPTSTLLSVLAGLLYPLPYALILAAFSETVGALIFFLIIRFAFKRSFLKEKLGRRSLIQKTYQKNPRSYLLCSRFSHLVPYWLINVLAALFRTSIWTFIWTTFIGVLPFCYLATETGFLLKHSHTFHYKLMTTPVKVSFLLLALLALTPVLWKAIIHKKNSPF